MSLSYTITTTPDRLLAIVNCSDPSPVSGVTSRPFSDTILKELTSVSIVNHLPHEDTCAVNYKNIANGNGHAKNECSYN